VELDLFDGGKLSVKVLVMIMFGIVVAGGVGRLDLA
jgi:hypothetical protein